MAINPEAYRDPNRVTALVAISNDGANTTDPMTVSYTRSDTGDTQTVMVPAGSPPDEVTKAVQVDLDIILANATIDYSPIISSVVSPTAQVITEVDASPVFQDPSPDASVAPLG